MKAISVKQPWAWMIVSGYFDVSSATKEQKDIENRSWTTGYRGPLLIQASLTFDYQGLNFIREEMELMIPDADWQGYLRGGIIGRTDLIDVVTNHSSKWAEPGLYNWVLANAIELPFVRYPGKLNLFDV